MTIFTALFGGFCGAWCHYKFQNKRISKVRDIAIKALKIFQDYAKKNQTYDKAASEFNNKIDVIEKRAILMALCKLGIPIAQPIDDTFNIENVCFDHVVINKDSIQLMIGQVQKGNCDHLFFSDVEVYFSSNSRLKAVRAVAKKYVDKDLAYCTYDKDKNVMHHAKMATDLFTPGEINLLGVFRICSAWGVLFDSNGKAIPEKLESLKREIDIGIWDTYLFWDYASYLNLLTQNAMGNIIANAFQQNLQTQQDMQMNKTS